MLAEADAKINKKLDIRRLIQDQVFIKAATSVLLSKSQIEFIKFLGINANLLGSEEKPSKERKS